MRFFPKEFIICGPRAPLITEIRSGARQVHSGFLLCGPAQRLLNSFAVGAMDHRWDFLSISYWQQPTGVLELTAAARMKSMVKKSQEEEIKGLLFWSLIKKTIMGGSFIPFNTYGRPWSQFSLWGTRWSFLCLVPTSLLSWSLPSSVSFSIHDRSDQEKRRDQAVTKILTSSSKFSGSYVLTLQTMKWDPENGWRGDEERLPGRTNLVYNPGGRSIILHLMLDS